MVHDQRYLQRGEGGVVVIDEKLCKVRFRLDQTSHIQVNGEICESCDGRPCLYACPVQNYRLNSDGRVEFLWQGCMECGACRIVCDKGAILWNLPRGGFGICLRYG